MMPSHTSCRACGERIKVSAIKCPHCQTILDPEAVERARLAIAAASGRTAPAAPSTLRRCPACAEKISVGVSICPECDERLDEELFATVAAAPATSTLPTPLPAPPRSAPTAVPLSPQPQRPAEASVGLSPRRRVVLLGIAAGGAAITLTLLIALWPATPKTPAPRLKPPSASIAADASPAHPRRRVSTVGLSPIDAGMRPADQASLPPKTTPVVPKTVAGTPAPSPPRSKPKTSGAAVAAPKAADASNKLAFVPPDKVPTPPPSPPAQTPDTAPRAAPPPAETPKQVAPADTVDPFKKPAGGRDPHPSVKTIPKTLSRDQIRAGLGKVRAQVQHCTAQNRQPGLYKIKITIEATGKVSAARIHRDAPSLSVATCIQGVVRTATFPPFSGAPITFVYPYALR